MKNQTFRMTMLFDFYGELLTARQGVRDVIVRAENYMTEIEDKTGLIKRFMQLQPHVEKITDAAEQIKQLNFRRYEDRQLEELAGVIEAEAAALKE